MVCSPVISGFEKQIADTFPPITAVCVIPSVKHNVFAWDFPKKICIAVDSFFLFNMGQYPVTIEIVPVFIISIVKIANILSVFDAAAAQVKPAANCYPFRKSCNAGAAQVKTAVVFSH